MSFFTLLADVVLPPICVHCRHEGAWLCTKAERLIQIEPVLINPLTIPGVDQVIIRATYDCEPLAQFIQQLKYHYWTAEAHVLPSIMRPLFGQLRTKLPTAIFPVPLHPRRQRERGFNQSDIIAHVLSQQTGFPLRRWLRRTRYTTPQARLSAHQRTSNVVGAFSDVKVARWPKSGILVDDVITTGSTIAECASVLRQSGVQHIIAVALAKG